MDQASFAEPLSPFSMPRSLAGNEGLSTSMLAKETLIVFDWDDTILPTSWLQRLHNNSGGFMLNSESQASMQSLAVACAETLLMATHMGTVIMITNSVPGWVDQSCQLFMPQLLELARRYNIVARPMHAPLTFKNGAFQREFKSFRNLISVGDGNAERSACLRLQAASDMTMSGRDARFVKNVKLIELPTCAQLISQQKMLQERFADIVSFRGHLDLKSRFSSSMSQCHNVNKVHPCTLVHFARPFGSTASMGSSTPWPSQQAAPAEWAGPRGGPPEESKMTGILSLRKLGDSANPGSPTPERATHGRPASGAMRTAGRQLPQLGGLSGASTGKNTPEPTESSSMTSLDRLRPEERDRTPGGTIDGEMDGGTGAGDTLMQAMGGSSAADAVDGNEAFGIRPSSKQEDRSKCGELTPGSASGRRSFSTGGVGTRKKVDEGLWKVHSTPLRGAGSPGGGLGKKRSVLPTGTRSTGAVWRENSAPAATRGF